MSAHIPTYQQRLADPLNRRNPFQCIEDEVRELRAALAGDDPEHGEPFMYKLPGDYDWHVDFAPLPKGAFRIKTLAGSPLPQQAADDERGDSWITAKVARHLDLAFRNGVSAGWNAGVDGNGEALQRLKSQVGTRAEYAALFPEPAQQAIQADSPATCTWKLDDDEMGTWASSCGELWSFIDGGPKENRVSFCHRCGKPTHVVPAPPTDQQGEPA